MRLLLTTTAGAGHLHPLLPLARAARDRGDEVTVAAPVELTDRVAAHGLRHAVLPSYDEAQLAAVMAVFAEVDTLPVHEGNERVIGEVFAGHRVALNVDAIAALVDDLRPDLLLHEALEFAGPLAAEARGIPSATVAMSLHAVLRAFAPAAVRGLAPHRERFGLDTDADPWAGAPYLSAVAASIDDGAPTGTHRYRYGDVHVAGGATPEVRSTDRPLLWATFGTETARIPGMLDRVVEPLATAADGLDAEVLLTTGHDVPVRPLPPNVRVEAYVPQEAVLAEASAVWCHGGFTTTMATLQAGLPLVLTPLFAADTFATTERLVAAGAAVHVRRPPDPAELRAALERVLTDDDLRRATEDLAAEATAHPAPGAALDALATEPVGAPRD